VFEAPELLLRPREAAPLLEGLAESVAQRKEVVRVERRVLKHLAGERPARPVRALELLVEMHTDVLVEQRSQPDGGLAQQLRGDPGVEDALRMKAAITIEQSEVVVRVVEDHLDAGIIEDRPESREVAHRQRIDDARLTSGRELDEVDPIDEAVEARGLRVHSDLGLACHPPDESSKLCGRLYIAVRRPSLDCGGHVVRRLPGCTGQRNCRQAGIRHATPAKRRYSDDTHTKL